MNDFSLPHIHDDTANTRLLREALSLTEEFRTVAGVFSQLSDATRLRIFWLLCHCEECVINIADLMDMSSPAVSHHLRSLRDAGLIESRRDGKEVFYRAADSGAAQFLHQMIEEVMRITCPEERQIPPSFRDDQIAVIRQVHDDLVQHLDARITIEELARRFHMNPTTLKEVFRAVYGNSLAAHVREHRMERAASLLRETDLSILEIAHRVGYDSQSKFTAAFKSCYRMLPKDYRKEKPPSSPSSQ